MATTVIPSKAGVYTNTAYAAATTSSSFVNIFQAAASPVATTVTGTVNIPDTPTIEIVITPTSGASNVDGAVLYTIAYNGFTMSLAGGGGIMYSATVSTSTIQTFSNFTIFMDFAGNRSGIQFDQMVIPPGYYFQVRSVGGAIMRYAVTSTAISQS